MNLVSIMVGLSIAGASAPVLMEMSLAPVIAQKRALNFGEAESLAVAYSAANEGKETKQAAIPDECEEENKGDGAWEVKCRGGSVDSKYVQYVTRSYRLIPPTTSYTNPDREFAWETPSRSDFSHVECPVNDPWGVGWYNEHLAAGHLGNCIPSPVWSSERYFESNPDDWLFDLTFWGYGNHPDF